MIMPFEDVFFEVFEMLKIEFSEGFSFSNASQEGNPQNILKDIIKPMYEADFIIADLTGLNPNVMYELGIAHCFGKKTIVITQDELSSLPFDLKQYRATNYDTYFKKFHDLILFLKGVLSDSVSFGNPVTDAMELCHIDKSTCETDLDDITDDEDRGFLDFMAEIEENLNNLCKNIGDMNDDMNTMSEGIELGTSVINRIKTSGEKGSTIKIRQEIKKVAGYIESFSSSLREKTVTMNALWDRIEKNTLSLIENPITKNDANKDGFLTYLDSLYQLRSVVFSNIPRIKGFQSVVNSTVGLERTMNQAIKFLDMDLTNYIQFNERMCCSIDKIKVKTEL